MLFLTFFSLLTGEFSFFGNCSAFANYLSGSLKYNVRISEVAKEEFHFEWNHFGCKTNAIKVEKKKISELYSMYYLMLEASIEKEIHTAQYEELLLYFNAY